VVNSVSISNWTQPNYQFSNRLPVCWVFWSIVCAWIDMDLSCIAAMWYGGFGGR
jgi:hypothetical protein